MAALRKRWWVVIPVVLLAVAGYLVWDSRTDSFTGPAPTVSASASCGGDAPGALLAFDAATGQQRWSARVGETFSLATTSGAVASLGTDRLRVLDARTGRARWCRSDTDATHALSTASGAVVVTDFPNVVAREASDGSQRWSLRSRADLLTSDGQTVVLGFGSDAGSMVTGIDGRTAAQRWHYRLPATEFSAYELPPLFHGGRPDLTFVHDGVGVVAAGPGQKPIRWQATVLRPIGIHGDVLLGGSLEPTGGVLTRFALEARDAATGAIRWRHSVPGFDAQVIGDLVVVLHQVVPADAPSVELTPEIPQAPRSSRSASVATAYDIGTGQPRWQRRLPFAGQIRAAGELAVVWLAPTKGSLTSGLIALDGRTGRPRWRSSIENPSRTERFHLPDELIGTAYESETNTVVVLVQATEPYRD
jgi:outer membrane protein assembly factor BamB